MKKIFVWVICAVLLLGMARPALAAEEISESALAAVEMSEPVGEEEIAAEQAINEELDAAADMEETCEKDTAEEGQLTVTGTEGAAFAN